jgi:hypothetical protein
LVACLAWCSGVVSMLSVWQAIKKQTQTDAPKKGHLQAKTAV